MSNRKVRKARDEAKAARINAELQRIYSDHGALRASDVVEESRPDDAPLHAEFEWNDAKAAHSHRLMQARTLIRVYVPVIERPNGEQVADPWIWVPPTAAESREAESREGEYHPTTVVIDKPDMFARALSALSSKMNAAIHACEELRDAARVARGENSDVVGKIAVAMTALQTASAAVKALH